MGMVPRRKASTRLRPVASTAMMALPTERATQLTRAIARFFHHGRDAPAFTSRTSKTAWTPPDPSHTKTSAAGAATEPRFQAAT